MYNSSNNKKPPNLFARQWQLIIVVYPLRLFSMHISCAFFYHGLFSCFILLFIWPLIWKVEYLCVRFAFLPSFFPFFLFFPLQDRVSLHTPGCPVTSSVDRADLKLTELHLPLLGSAGIKCVCTPPTPAVCAFQYFLLKSTKHCSRWSVNQKLQ